MGTFLIILGFIFALIAGYHVGFVRGIMVVMRQGSEIYPDFKDKMHAHVKNQV